VSVGTVSNVLNRPDAVAEATRSRVQAAIEALGYVRNESARQLRAGRSRLIGLVVLDVANPFFTDVARGVEEAAAAADAVVMLCNSANDPDKQARHVEVLAQQRVRGVLITPVHADDAVIALLDQHGIPVVLVDRGSDSPGRCSVSVDDVHGGRLAGEHLLAAGHRRIAFVGGPLSIPQVEHRLAGLRQGAAAAAGHGAEVQVLETAGLGTADGREAVDRLVAGGVADSTVTAVVCANDLIALGVLQEAHRRGLRVPEDLAIVGYDDIEFAAAAAVPLSSVRQPREHLGRTATELLLEEADLHGAPHVHRHVVFPPELVVRASSDHRRTPAAVVA
jgi:DNA-binding LacI/PurR family transcriptional regulator